MRHSVQWSIWVVRGLGGGYVVGWHKYYLFVLRRCYQVGGIFCDEIGSHDDQEWGRWLMIELIFFITRFTVKISLCATCMGYVFNS